jgi:predicted nucleotidyltransferase
MTSRLSLTAKKGLTRPPKWVPDNVHYEVITGSVAYGVSSDTSDMDVVGFVMPPLDMMFPHLRGEIPGFGTQVSRFEQYSEHHIMDAEANQEYDFTMYSIVKFFQLCMENNPNMVDTLFVPQRCVLHITPTAQMVRDNRRMFLHRGSFSKFRGYAFSNLSKIRTKANSSNPKRQESIQKYGFDTKHAYHVVRLALEAEQILQEGDLDITKNREVLKSIRRGEWTAKQIENWFTDKERQLDELYQNSTLRSHPDESAIRNLLLSCIENHYGSVDKVLNKGDRTPQLVREMEAVLEKYR